MYVLARQPEKLNRNLKDQVTICEGSEKNIEHYRKIIQQCELIFHLAGNATLGNDGDYEQSNVNLTRKLIGLVEGSQRIKRFVFTSTIGAVDRCRSDRCLAPLNEDSIPNPLSAYGQSKLACETLLRESRIPYTIVRPAWVYGPGMRSNSHVRVLLDAVCQKKFFSKIDFPGRVSTIYVQDLIDALILVSEHPDAARNTYFACNQKAVSLGNLFRGMGEVLGIEGAGGWKIFFGVPWIFRAFRRCLPLRVQNLFSHVLWADPSKLAALGFQTKTDLKTGLMYTAHWHFQEQRCQSSQNEVRDEVNPLAVITGGANGIGKALSHKLYARGYDISIIDCDKPAGEQSVAMLNAEFICADLSSDEEINRVVTHFVRCQDRLQIWINNAGVGFRESFLKCSHSAIGEMINTNCKALVVFSQLAFASFRRSGKGILINIGSSSGFQPLPHMAVYCATKSFVIRFTEALIGELKRAEAIKLFCISPSGTRTRFQNSAHVKTNENEKLLTPEYVANQILGYTHAKSGHYIIGFSGRLMYSMSHLIPGRVQILLWKFLMERLR